MSLANLSRRAFIAGLPLGLAACGASSYTRPNPMSMLSSFGPAGPEYLAMYGEMDDGAFHIPAVDLKRIKPEFYRRQVEYGGDEMPGTIVIDTPNRYLYLVQDNGMAMRYGVGVGREGFAWSGDAVVKRKAEWPSWHPPVEMQARDPKSAIWANGMPGGLDNPLGARAHYLYQGDRDTLYRIHGTSEPWTIGTNVSSGCIRLVNQDVIDLYNRVPIGTVVKVIPNDDSIALTG